ncbi:MAG: hypothetical protein AAGH48_07245, partial [Pseudomonadota bacterium]
AKAEAHPVLNMRQRRLGRGAFRCVLIAHSTVTDFARLRGWSTSVPFATATNYARSWWGAANTRGLANENGWEAIEAPKSHPLLSPLVFAAPIQLLAYFVAVAKGTDVDQPRNLAKSVTVE